MKQLSLKKKKILHLFSGDITGGAAKGALNLHFELKKRKIKSFFFNDLFFEKKTNLKKKNFFLRSISNLIALNDQLNFLDKRKKIKFSHGFKNNFTNLNFINNFDILHLHWIGRGIINLDFLKKIKIPIIWTMRDMWTFTGGCHYSLNCTSYTVICSSCPFFKKNIKTQSLILKLFYKKQKLYKTINKNIHFVAISKWIYKISKQSALLRGHKIYQINNFVDEKNFFPEKKYLKNKKKIILVGSNNLNDEIKQNTTILKFINIINKRGYYITSFGKGKIINNKIHNSGFVTNREQMRQLYNNSKAYVTFAKQEAFGKTILESLFCGKPVIALKNENIDYLVKHKKNGFILQDLKNETFNQALDWLDKQDQAKLRNICIKSAKQFSLNFVVDKYIKLYKKSLIKKC